MFLLRTSVRDSTAALLQRRDTCNAAAQTTKSAPQEGPTVLAAPFLRLLKFALWA